jgi:hypothetical protein
MSLNKHNRWICDSQVLDMFLDFQEQRHPSSKPTIIVYCDPQSRMIQGAIITFEGDKTLSREPKHDEQ